MLRFAFTPPEAHRRARRWCQTCLQRVTASGLIPSTHIHAACGDVPQEDAVKNSRSHVASDAMLWWAVSWACTWLHRAGGFPLLQWLSAAACMLSVFFVAPLGSFGPQVDIIQQRGSSAEPLLNWFRRSAGNRLQLRRYYCYCAVETCLFVFISVSFCKTCFSFID